MRALRGCVECWARSTLGIARGKGVLFLLLAILALGVSVDREVWLLPLGLSLLYV